jgi:hypothetical protein
MRDDYPDELKNIITRYIWRIQPSRGYSGNFRVFSPERFITKNSPLDFPFKYVYYSRGWEIRISKEKYYKDMAKALLKGYSGVLGE